MVCVSSKRRIRELGFCFDRFRVVIVVGNRVRIVVWLYRVVFVGWRWYRWFGGVRRG